MDEDPEACGCPNVEKAPITDTLLVPELSVSEFDTLLDKVM